MTGTRDIWGTAPPEPRSRMANWPTVLFSWWCTCFAAVIIITRLLGRKVRSNRLFKEDWIMMASLIPLFIRMVFVHFVLIYGTNNINVSNTALSPTRLHNHETGARLVLAARIFYAAFIWTCKLTMSEFLKRITIRVWRRSWEVTLQAIRITFGVTFVAVIVATLSECHPFDHYWQVVPDPGPHCRQGFAQLITMGTCDIFTDILLIAFPIPVVLNSGQGWKRKTQMILLFSLSAIMIGITATRMPKVIRHAGRQQYRTVWASCEILAAASVSNAVILGSFLRDKGTKKNKYRTFSVTGSIDRPSTRRATLNAVHDLDSDEDLFRTLGCRLPEHLRGEPPTSPRLAPPALPAKISCMPQQCDAMSAPRTQTNHGRRDSGNSDDSLIKPVTPHEQPKAVSHHTHGMSFFDIGGLLEDSERSTASRSCSTTVIESGSSVVVAQDFAVAPASNHHASSRAFLRDVGGILSPLRNESRERDSFRRGPRPCNAPMGVLGPMLERHETQVSLQDAGGLLGTASEPASDQAAVNSTSVVSTPGCQGVPSLAQSAPAVPTRSQSGAEDIELEDVGDLLEEERRLKPGTLSLQEALASTRDHSVTTCAPSRAEQWPDDMILHDPGGLMTP